MFETNEEKSTLSRDNSQFILKAQFFSVIVTENPVWD